jgi:hypothetical protein
MCLSLVLSGPLADVCLALAFLLQSLSRSLRQTARNQYSNEQLETAKLTAGFNALQVNVLQLRRPPAP